MSAFALCPYLAGYLDASSLRMFRNAAIRARAGEFPREYPPPEAIEAMADCLLSLLAMTGDKDLTLAFCTEAGELEESIRDSEKGWCDLLENERDRTTEAQDETRRVETEHDKLVDAITRIKAILGEP